jgi:hypothetical protein
LGLVGLFDEEMAASMDKETISIRQDRLLFWLSLAGLPVGLTVHVLTYLSPYVPYQTRDLYGLTALTIISQLLYRRAYRYHMLRNLYHYKGWDWPDGRFDTPERKRRFRTAGFLLLQSDNLRESLPNASPISRWIAYPVRLLCIVYLCIAAVLASMNIAQHWLMLRHAYSLFASVTFLASVIVYSSQFRQKK